MENLNRGEALELQTRIELFQRAQHVRVVGERQVGMEAADDVKLRDAEVQGLARFVHHLLDGELKAIGVTLLASKSAELAAQDAIVGVIDVAVDDIAGAVANLSVAHKIRNRAHRVQVFAFEEPERLVFVNAFARDYLVVDVAQLAALQKKFHCTRNPPRKSTSETVTIRKTTLISALSRKNATLIHCRLRRRANQCSSNRLIRMMNRPTKYATRKRKSNPNSSNKPHIKRCERKAALSAFFGPHATTSERKPCD